MYLNFFFKKIAYITFSNKQLVDYGDINHFFIFNYVIKINDISNKFYHYIS
jgi:hypothetical protein